MKRKRKVYFMTVSLHAMHPQLLMSLEFFMSLADDIKSFLLGNLLESSIKSI